MTGKKENVMVELLEGLTEYMLVKIEEIAGKLLDKLHQLRDKRRSRW